MPHHKAQKKSLKQDVRRRLRNKRTLSSLRTAMRKLRAAVAAGENDTAAAIVAAVQAQIDRTASAGVIHHRTAARHKSRLMGMVSPLKQG
jgi:small subunit ribosomal protein S20